MVRPLRLNKMDGRMNRNIARALVLPLLALSVASCGAFGGKDKPKTPTLGSRSPILSRIATDVKPDPTLASVAVVLPPAVANAEWTQAGGNASKAPGHLELSATPTRAWQVQIAGTSPKRRLAASPIVGGGVLFAMDTNGVVHAFDAASGARKWTYAVAVERNLDSANFGGGVTFADGKLYVTSGAGDVIALNAADGSQLWRVKPGGPLRGSPTVAFNAVYVMTQNNEIMALNMLDGAPVWQDAASSSQTGVFGVAAPAAGQGTVIAGYSSGEVVAYRYENGRNLWSDALARTSISTQVGTLTDVDADPIIDQGRVYALGQGGRMAAYELVTGQRLWELTLAGISTPAVSGEWVFTLTDDSRLLAIARNTGRIRWLTEMKHWRNPNNRTNPVFWTGPVLASNRLWIASSEGEVQSVDVMTGTATPFTELDAGVSLAPIVANKTLYILDDSGRITAFR